MYTVTFLNKVLRINVLVYCMLPVSLDVSRLIVS
jgi:hypothetical protein